MRDAMSAFSKAPTSNQFMPKYFVDLDVLEAAKWVRKPATRNYIVVGTSVSLNVEISCKPLPMISWFVLITKIHSGTKICDGPAYCCPDAFRYSLFVHIIP